MALDYANIPLNQRIIIQFPDDEVGRGVRIEILDGQDDDAAGNAAAWAAGEFSLDDLLFTLLSHAQIEVTEADETTCYTGETFQDGAVLRDLDGVEPASVTFADLEPAS
jgi:hypothetical protein